MQISQRSPSRNRLQTWEGTKVLSTAARNPSRGGCITYLNSGVTLWSARKILLISRLFHFDAQSCYLDLSSMKTTRKNARFLGPTKLSQILLLQCRRQSGFVALICLQVPRNASDIDPFRNWSVKHFSGTEPSTFLSVSTRIKHEHCLGMRVQVLTIRSNSPASCRLP